jgi:hypothetical protein
MKINCAAHGDVSSCPLIFKHLATILLKTLNTTDADPSDESLAALFPASFS